MIISTKAKRKQISRNAGRRKSKISGKKTRRRITGEELTEILNQLFLHLVLMVVLIFQESSGYLRSFRGFRTEGKEVRSTGGWMEPVKVEEKGEEKEEEEDEESPGKKQKTGR